MVKNKNRLKILHYFKNNPLASYAGVIDLKDKFKEKQEQNEANKIKNQFNESSKEEDESPIYLDDLEKRREQKFKEEVNKSAGIWQHQFSSVRKDNEGFFIYKKDNVAGNKMAPGDLLADMAINMTPYWEVSSIKGDRINLKAIPPNPFVTGVGAGGAKLTQYDLDVFTGAEEKKKLQKIQEKLDTNSAELDDVIYLLDGTVPTNMGPNGAQGGWYTCDDTYSNRGGRKGLKPETIMMNDAKKLKDLGFDVPVKALNGTLSTTKWNEWITGNGSDVEYYPKNVDKYVDFAKKMTEKGRWRYDVDEFRRKYDPNAVSEYWEKIIADFQTLSKEEFKQKYPYQPDNLKDLVEVYSYRMRELEKRKESAKETQTEAEDDSEASILRNIFNKNRRIAIKNTNLLIEMAKEDPKYVSYLYDMIRMGGTDWFANEYVIKFFDLTDDIEGLKLAAEHLKDPTNLRYTFSFLSQHGEIEYVKQKLEETGSGVDLELLNSVLYNIKKSSNQDSWMNYKRNDYIIDLAKRFNLVDRFQALVNTKNYQERHYASETIPTILQAFGPNTEWKPGDTELVNQFKSILQQLR